MHCPCGSGKKYENCCKKYHDGAPPENALKLMKARYSAYAKHKLNFLFDTLHPNLRPATFDDFVKGMRKNARYQRLQIRDFQESGSHATVTFTAFISMDGHDATFTEKSEFEKLDDRWLYKSGAIYPGPLPKIPPNE